MYLERTERTAPGTLEELRERASKPTDRILIAHRNNGEHGFGTLAPLLDGGVVWQDGYTPSLWYKNDQLIQKRPHGGEWQCTPNGMLYIQKGRTITYNDRRFATLPTEETQWFATERRGVLIYRGTAISLLAGARETSYVGHHPMDLRVDPVRGVVFYCDFASISDTRLRIFANGNPGVLAPSGMTSWGLTLDGQTLIFLCQGERHAHFWREYLPKPIVVPAWISEWHATPHHIFGRDDKGRFWRDSTNVLTLPEEYDRWTITGTNDIVVDMGNDLYLYPVSVTVP